MAALFGKAPEEKTFLILDIENGSAGAALAHYPPHLPPKLFGAKRVELPLLPTLQSDALAKYIEQAVREALSHATLVAGRLRNASSEARFAQLGDIAEASVFLAAPWGAPNLGAGQPDFISGMQHFLRQELAGYTQAPVHFYTAAGAAAHGSISLYPEQALLVFLVQGELLELILVDGGAVEGYATIPSGYRTLMRTLMTHAGLTPAEAHSALQLKHLHQTFEPLNAAAEHLSASLYPTLEQLVPQGKVSQLLVVAHEPSGEWLARTLAEDERIALLFPHGGDIRALTSRHLAPQVDAYAPASDVMLMLDALYLHSRLAAGR